MDRIGRAVTLHYNLRQFFFSHRRLLPSLPLEHLISVSTNGFPFAFDQPKRHPSTARTKEISKKECLFVHGMVA